MILNRLDGSLGAEGVLDNGVLVPGGLFLDRSLGGNGLACESGGRGKSESNLVPDLGLNCSVDALLNSRSRLLCFLKMGRHGRG